MYSGPDGEFVELTNVGGAAVDMTGWSYDDNSNTPGSFSLSGFGSIAAGESVLVTEGNAETFRSAWGLAGGVKILGGSGGPAALGRNDTINVWDAANTLVDRLRYGDEDFPGSIRTQNLSGWVCTQGLGDNDPYKWTHSAVADAQSTVTSAGGAIGSPGGHVDVPCPVGACCVLGSCAESVFGHDCTSDGGTYLGDGTDCAGDPCPQAPVILSVNPPALTAVATLDSVVVTFAAGVTGVTAGALTVDGSAATSVSGSGAGPYEFTGFATPAAGSADIAVGSGSIVSDPGGVPFAGDSWTVAVGTVIVINELNYHPHDSLDPNQFSEFLELYNAGTANVDVSGWTTTGVVSTIPGGTVVNAGEYLVLALNPGELAARTGHVGALPWTSGNLSNSGETVTLRDNAGNLIDWVAYSDGGDWPSSPDGGGPTLELINPDLANEFASAWRASVANYGTPGQVNSAYVAAPAPLLLAPMHSPSIPAANTPVLVTVTCLDDGPVPPTVTLWHRLDQDPVGTYASTVMHDDGLHGDGDASDGVFGAELPGLADGEQYDFYITADDGLSISTFPANHPTANPACSASGCLEDPSCSPCQTLLCKFSGEALPVDFPVLHILVPRRTKNLQEGLTCSVTTSAFDPCQTEFDATFVDHTGKVYYNVTERYRGQSSILLNPKSYAVSFPSDNQFNSPLGFPVRRLILNGNQPTRQKLGFDIFRSAGLPASRCEFVRLRYTGINYDVTSIGSNGFNGLYACVERVDNDFLESQGGLVVPDRELTSNGNLYRGENTASFDWRGTNPNSYRVNAWGFNGYSKENNEELDDWTDLLAILDAMNNSPPASYASNVANLIHEDACLRYFAVHMILGNKEGGIYRESGDDYFLYTNPPGHPDGYNARFITWDSDSVLINSNTETIWRTGNASNVLATIRNFLRHNGFAPIFVKDISDLVNIGPLTIADFNARIDAMPDAAFFTSGGTSAVPRTRVQFKNWFATRVNFINNEIIDNLTLSGVPASPYTAPNPVITLSGQLNQAGTHAVTLNGQPVTFSVYTGSWSQNVTLYPGINKFTVRAFDRQGVETQSVSGTVLYDPPAATPGLRLTAPNRMVDSKTLTLKAEILDPYGNIAARTCTEVGTVSAVRLSDGSPVPTSVTVFETYPAGAGAGGPAPDSIRFYNGIGSVSITLDAGAATPPGDILVTVTVGALSATRVVEVLDGEAPGLFRTLSGALSGADLTWAPTDGVIRLTGTVTVASGTLNILPGTLIMVDAGPPADGTAVLLQTTGVANAPGTRTQPIFFFPTAGPAAMALPQTAHNNFNSWRGIYHQSHGTSFYSHVFITGAGNGIVSGHPRPPIMRVQNSHNLTMEDCVLADCPGMGTAAPAGATGTYTFRRCLFSRLGLGGEWLASACTLLVEDTWFTRIGWALESSNVDGDILHLDRPNNSYTIRRSVLTDCGDDLIDHSKGAQPIIEDSLLYDTRDKIVSIGPLSEGPQATLTMTNCLIFDGPGGIRCNGAPAYLTNCTVGRGTNINGKGSGSVLRKSIFWTNSTATCTGTVDHSIVGNPNDLGCGSGNLSVNPQFTNTSCDYRPVAGSPALTAGPGGSKIGWLGFPAASSCLSDAECNDGDPCTDDVCGLTGHCVSTNNTAACDDGNPCTSNDVCAEGACAGVPIIGCYVCILSGDCDDELECTDDDCVDGLCIFTPTQQGTACTDDGNVCTDNVCDGDGECIGVSNTVACDDADPCTDTDTCADGACAGTLIPGCFVCDVPADCDDVLECTVDDCVDGFCVFTPTPNGTPCTDDGNVCTDNVCDGAGACAAVNNAAPCDDGLFCNGADTCDGGICSLHAGDPCTAGPECAATCNEDVDNCLAAEGTPCTADEDVCTDDVCDGAGACVAEFNTALCDDGDPCTSDDACAGGVCSGAVIPGCFVCLIPEDCDDDLECTDDDCVEGFCAFTPKTEGVACTDDGNVCTDNACDGAGACVATPNTLPCDDADPCTSDDACAGGVCAGMSVPGCVPCETPADCDDGLECTDDDCVEDVCVAAPTTAGTVCTDDGNVCTDNVCDGAGVCVAVNNAAPCDDGLFCNGSDTCDGGTCSMHAGDPCAGGAECAATCNEDDDNCFAAEGTPCTADEDVCTDDVCDGAGACVAEFNTASCDDGDPCTSEDACVEGVCSGVVIPGCFVCVTPEDCDDGLECTDDDCADGFCVFTPTLVGTVCADDGNICTDNACDGAGACVATPNTLPCDDADPCTDQDVCASGVCAGVPIPGCFVCDVPADCDDGLECTDDGCVDHFCTFTPTATGTACTDDGNVCTDNVCDGAGVCAAVNNAAPCDDGLFCNGSDACDGGTCSVHEGDPCMAGAECAATCNEDGDNCFAPTGTPCSDDGDLCTSDACDGAGLCTSMGDPSICDDGDACTIDSCHSQSGCAYEPVGCDDGDLCTDDACDAGTGCTHSPNSCYGACCIDGACVETLYPDCHPFICDVAQYVQVGKPVCFGDADGNGVVNAADRGGISASIDQTDPVLICRFDLDGNGVINAADRGVVSANIGLCSPLPDYQDGSALNNGEPDTRFGVAIFVGAGTSCAVELCPE